jgi:hypothetical protein
MGAWIKSLTPSDLVAIGSALIALVSFVFNWVVVGRQTALQSESLKAQMDADVLAWGGDSMDALTKAQWLARNRGGTLSSEEFRRERNLVLASVSGLIDKGRLFFPNRITKTTARHKARAFRGGRPFVLNPLVFACHALERLDYDINEPDAEAATFFMGCRREFVSELQHHLDPRRRAEELRRLGLAKRAVQLESYDDSLKLALALDALYPGVLELKGDDGWAKNIARAKSGDSTPFQELGR